MADPLTDGDKPGEWQAANLKPVVVDHAKDKRIAELEAALFRLAAWGLLVKPYVPDNEPLPAGVPHLSLTIGDARAALKAVGRDKLVCPICEGACSTNH